MKTGFIFNFFFIPFYCFSSLLLPFVIVFLSFFLSSSCFLQENIRLFWSSVSAVYKRCKREIESILFFVYLENVFGERERLKREWSNLKIYVTLSIYRNICLRDLGRLHNFCKRVQKSPNSNNDSKYYQDIYFMNELLTICKCISISDPCWMGKFIYIDIHTLCCI